jgi:hypothetical protein
MPWFAVARSLSLANASIQCAPRSSDFLKTAPRWKDATNVDSIAFGPG